MSTPPLSIDPEARERPLPSASQMLALLGLDEPNDPDSPDGTLADVLDLDLGPGLREWAAALAHASAKVRRHDGGTSMISEELDDLACALTQAAYAARSVGAVIRGQMRPFPWRPAGPDPCGEPGLVDAAFNEPSSPGQADAATETAPAPESSPEPGVSRSAHRTGEADREPPLAASDPSTAQEEGGNVGGRSESLTPPEASAGDASETADGGSTDPDDVERGA